LVRALGARFGDSVALVPPKTSGYSEKPLSQKLGIARGNRIALLGSPEDFEKTLGALPVAAILENGLIGKAPFDLVLCFVVWRAELERQLPSIRRRMAPAAGLWVAWPKKTSKTPTDMTDHVIREIALPTGLVDNKVCAIDEKWSGLRLVIRIELRS
jgi:hypothetical protein